MKRLSVLGSTGSIGINTLEVVRQSKDKFRVVCLSAGENWRLLAEQIMEFRPDFAIIANPTYKPRIDAACRQSGTEVFCGPSELCDIGVTDKIDIVVSGIMGAAGLLPAIKAVKKGKILALANKEPLVMAGALLSSLAKENKGQILPVDSEHSAIFQCLHGHNKSDINCVYLTASGGPFRGKTVADLSEITVEQALNHPTWNMGKKITIDSATLMNKALEIIEAHWLFDLSKEQINVIIHPQSIIHSIVEFIDGSQLAQMGLPDMKIPIRYALSYPERWKANTKVPDWAKINKLEFFEPDRKTFTGLKLAERVVEEGGVSGAVLNAANEVAVERFLTKEIKFLDIFRLIDNMMEKTYTADHLDLDNILSVDRETRQKAIRWRP